MTERISAERTNSIVEAEIEQPTFCGAGGAAPAALQRRICNTLYGSYLNLAFKADDAGNLVFNDCSPETNALLFRRSCRDH